MNVLESKAARIGVVIVCYSAEKYIVDCLESLVSTGYPALQIVVVDNNSPDDTLAVIRGWADGSRPYHRHAHLPLPDTPSPQPKPVPLREMQAEKFVPPVPNVLTLIRSDQNLGFAGGVNLGLRHLLPDQDIDLFWLLNPDTVIEPQTPFAFARKAAEMDRFAVLGGRALFLEAPDLIHADAGRLHPLAGTAISVNRGEKADDTPMPPEAEVDYVPGISLVASRDFVERAGFMKESYFLYFEEIDWQLRRGDLPFGLEAEARVFHHAGAAIGSSGIERSASPFSTYFMARNLLPFIARWQPWKLPFAYAIAWAKVLRGGGADASQLAALARGLHRMGPPASVRARLKENDWERILSRK